MKRYIVFVLILAFCSCSKENGLLTQESPSTFERSKIFSEYSLAVSAVDGIMEPAMSTNGYRNRYMSYFGYNTDIETHMMAKGKDTEPGQYDVTPNQQRLNCSNDIYASFFQSIEYANLAIDGLRRYGGVEKNDAMRALLGEALVMRAFIYYDLTRAFGDVPARFEPLTSETIYIKKSSRDVIFRQMLKDLEEAIPYLKYPGSSTRYSTACVPNKVFAEGLYARYALVAAGFALRPDDGKVGTGNMGSVRKSSDPELAPGKTYSKALAYLEDAIQNGGMHLAADFEEYWRGFNNSEHVLKPTEETVYALPFANNWGRWNFSFAIRVASTPINGYVITRSSFAGPAATFYWDYDRNDKRRDVTCANWRYDSNGVCIRNIAEWYFGKYRYDQMVDNPFKEGANDDGIKAIVMRYADILLMASEIANELGQMEKAKAYFKPVRARAFNQAEAESFLAAISDKNEMFNAIVDERAFEFCGEFLRKTDLIRWGMLKKKIDETKAKMYELRDRRGRYAFLPADIYYKVNPADKWELVFYGFNEGETGNPGSGWTKKTKYFSSYNDNDADTKAFTSLCKNKIEGLYLSDPDQHQFWPIFTVDLAASQGSLVNDYGY